MPYIELACRQVTWLVMAQTSVEQLPTGLLFHVMLLLLGGTVNVKINYELLCNLRDKQLYYIISQKAKKNKLNLNVYINYIQHKFAIISILTSLD